MNMSVALALISIIFFGRLGLALSIKLNSSSQSSTGSGGVPARAIDGNTNGSWGSNSCTHTVDATNNWWMANLAEFSEVNKVILYTRSDCCSERIDGAKVYIGDAYCGEVVYEAGKLKYEVECGNALGGNVKVVQHNKILTLCEVQVIGIPSAKQDQGQCPASHPYVYRNGQWCCKSNKENITGYQGTKCDGSVIQRDSLCCAGRGNAVKCPSGICDNYLKPAEQQLELIRAEMSSTLRQEYSGSNLIDGDINSFAATNSDGQLMRVTFKEISHVTRVEISNRGDCCQNRAIGFSVNVKIDGRITKICGKITTAQAKYSFDCDAYGDQVELVKNTIGELNIAEIEVYGTPGGDNNIPKLILYGRSGHTGPAVTLRGPNSNLANNNFDDTARSAWAVEGDWELYQNGQYDGARFLIKDGSKHNLDRSDYTSARPANCRYVADAATAQLIVYDGDYWQGESTEFLLPQRDLKDWNNKISSVKAIKGDWEFYGSFDFASERFVVREGESSNFPGFGNKPRSLRPICLSYRGKGKCTLNRIEIIDNGQLEPQFKGTEVIGSQSSGSCYGTAWHSITIANTDSVTESTSVEIGESSEINWETSLSVAVESEVKILGSGISFGAELGVSAGGSHTVSTSQAKETSTGNSKTSAQETSFDVPGAGILYGIVDRYEVDQTNIPVKMHMTCPGGRGKTVDNTVAFKAVSFAAAHFWSLTGKFTKEACKKNRSLPKCVENVKRQFSSHIGKKEEIRTAFKKCFGDGKKDEKADYTNPSYT